MSRRTRLNSVQGVADATATFAPKPTSGVASSSTFHRGDGVWSPAFATPGPLELADCYAYGHSYPAGGGTPGLPASSYAFPNRISGRTRANAFTNRAVSGYFMADVVGDMTTGARIWTPGTKGFVVLDCVINSIINVTSSLDSIQRTGFQNDLRSALRIMRSSAWLINTDGSVAYTGTWVNTNLTGLARTRGTIAKAQSATAVATITTTQRNICVTVLGFPITTGASPFTVTVNGVLQGTYTTTSASSATSAAWSMLTVPVYGMPAGTNTIVVQPTTTADFYFQGYLVMNNSTPPGICVVKDVKLTAAGYAVIAADSNRNDAGLAVYNGFIDSICAEAEFADGTIVVADPQPAFDKTTMLQTDQVHPNGFGHAVYADAVQSATTVWSVRNGLNAP